MLFSEFGSIVDITLLIECLSNATNWNAVEDARSEIDLTKANQFMVLEESVMKNKRTLIENPYHFGMSSAQLVLTDKRITLLVVLPLLACVLHCGFEREQASENV